MDYAYWRLLSKDFEPDNRSVSFRSSRVFHLNLAGLKNEPPRNKTNKMTLRPAKTQISLGIRPVWSESSLCTQWEAKDPSFLHADSEDSDQTGRMPRLIWVFAGHTCHFVGFVTRRLIYCSHKTIKHRFSFKDNMSYLIKAYMCSD